MKKLVCFVMALAVCFACAACGGNKPAAEYKPEAGTLDVVNGQVFDGEVVIYIAADATAENRSQITFENCTFNKGVKIIGDLSGYITFEPGCTFAEGSKIVAVEATKGFAQKGTLEDDFIKVFVGAEGVEIESTALITALSTSNMIVNGVKYDIADFENSEIFCVCTYYIDGEPAIYTEG